ncbi:MAG: C-terminal target protein [Bacteroidetes bacterium]|nr:C-terminal target protein [Bacteroidota bacterium]
MKKIFILFAGIGLSLGVAAQQVPNGGFENWNDSLNPIGWNTLANYYAPLSVYAVRDTLPQTHTEGLASIKMHTDTVGGQGQLRSYLGLGTITLAVGPPTYSGVAYAKKPDTLFFDYAYQPGVGLDTAQVVVNFFQAGVSIFGGARTFHIPPAPTGGSLAFPLTSFYTGSGAPDTLSIIFKSGKSPGAEFNSTLWLDNVHFDASVVLGIPDAAPAAGVSAYPNPANSTINIAVAPNEVGSHIQLIDMAGREVYNGTLNSATSSIDTRNLASGLYAIHVSSVDHLTVYKGSISVAH